MSRRIEGALTLTWDVNRPYHRRFNRTVNLSTTGYPVLERRWLKRRSGIALGVGPWAIYVSVKSGQEALEGVRKIGHRCETEDERYARRYCGG